MDGARVVDAITEWWVHPVATRVEGRTVFGAVSSTGEILACEMDHATGATQRFVQALTEPDDHNVPALWAAAGRRSVLVWSRHGRDQVLRVQVSGPNGSVSTFGAPSTIDLGDRVSYAQVHRVAAQSSAERDVFWVFCRVTTLTWQMVPVTVVQSTGAVSFGTPVTLLTATAQTYISTADAHGQVQQVIRFAWGYNPASPVSAIRYVEINGATGAVTSPVDGSVSANVITGTGLPLVDETIAPLIDEPPTGWSRRLFYVRPGPATPGVAYADWPIEEPDTAVYRVTALGTAGWSTTEHGPAGPRIGYLPTANYLPGMSFPSPCPGDVVVLARQDGDTSTVEVVTDGVGTILGTSTASRLIRPIVPVGADASQVVVSDVTRYSPTAYTDYQADVVALFAPAPAPVVTVSSDQVVILCGELRSGRILATVPVSGASWEQVLCDAGQIGATVPVLSDAVAARPELFLGLEGARSYLAVAYRDSVLEAGPIWAHDYDGGASVAVTAAGMWSMWDHRRVMKVLTTAAERANPGRTAMTWSGVSLGTLAKRLIATSMSHTGGYLPIDLPADVPGAQTRTYPGYEVATVADRVRQLMGVRGGPEIAFEPRFTADGLAIRWLMRTGRPNDPMLRQTGADWEWDTTLARGPVSELGVQRDWSGLVMRAWATGEGQDKALPVAYAEDRALLDRGYPLLESATAHGTVKVRSTLVGHAQAGLRRGVRARSTWTLAVEADGRPRLDQYRPGDFARVRVAGDHPYLRHYLPGGSYRTRITGIAGDLSPRVSLSFQPEVDAR